MSVIYALPLARLLLSMEMLSVTGLGYTLTLLLAEAVLMPVGHAIVFSAVLVVIGVLLSKVMCAVFFICVPMLRPLFSFTLKVTAPWLAASLVLLSSRLIPQKLNCITPGATHTGCILCVVLMIFSVLSSTSASSVSSMFTLKAIAVPVFWKWMVYVSLSVVGGMLPFIPSPLGITSFTL